MSDNEPTIAELKERLEFYESRGWDSPADDVREQIAELKGERGTEQANDLSPEEEAELEERLECFERWGWDSAAEMVQAELEGSQ